MQNQSMFHMKHILAFVWLVFADKYENTMAWAMLQTITLINDYVPVNIIPKRGEVYSERNISCTLS